MKPFLGDLRIGGDGMKGLAGCGGLSGGLQRQDNQHGFILTFVSAISSKTKSKSLKAGHSVRHVVMDAFWVHLSPDMAIWSDPSWNDQSCCPAQGQRPPHQPPSSHSCPFPRPPSRPPSCSKLKWPLLLSCSRSKVAWPPSWTQPWPCWVLNFLSQHVTDLEHICAAGLCY